MARRRVRMEGAEGEGDGLVQETVSEVVKGFMPGLSQSTSAGGFASPHPLEFVSFLVSFFFSFFFRLFFFS